MLFVQVPGILCINELSEIICSYECGNNYKGLENKTVFYLKQVFTFALLLMN